MSTICLLNVNKPVKSYNTDERSIHDLMARLKLIGQVQKYQKLNIKTLNFEVTSFWSSFKRFWYQENRQDTLEFVRTTIFQSFNLFYAYANDKSELSINMCRNLISDLQNAVTGIEALQVTYEKDKMFCAQLSVISRSIQIKLQDINTNYPMIANELYFQQMQLYNPSPDLKDRKFSKDI